jgi:hypothetical protein
MSIHIDVKRYYCLTGKISNIFSILLVVIFIFLVGFRPLEVGADTVSYLHTWNEKMRFFNVSTDLFFYYIMYLTKTVGFSYQYFLLVVSILFFTIIHISYKKISKHNNINLFLFLFSFFSFFFCLSLSTNVIRQGISLVFLLLAYSYYNQINNKKIAFVCLFLSIGFHMTAIIPISLFLIAYICKKVNLLYFYFLYVAGIIMAYIGYGIKNASPFLLEILANDKRVSYLSDEETHYVVEFKTQFVIFNSIFLIIFAILNRINKDKKYEYLLKYYVLSSFVFFLAFQIPFSDRLGLFSWFVIPLLFSPVFSLNIKKKLNTFSVLFMIFIYLFFNALYK